jgi:hypothetical protein
VQNEHLAFHIVVDAFNEMGGGVAIMGPAALLKCLYRRKMSVVNRIFGCKKGIASLFVICTFSPNIFSVIELMMRWARHVEHVGKTENEYNIFVGNSEGKKPLTTLRRRW